MGGRAEDAARGGRPPPSRACGGGGSGGTFVHSIVDGVDIVVKNSAASAAASTINRPCGAERVAVGSVECAKCGTAICGRGGAISGSDTDFDGKDRFVSTAYDSRAGERDESEPPPVSPSDARGRTGTGADSSGLTISAHSARTPPSFVGDMNASRPARPSRPIRRSPDEDAAGALCATLSACVEPPDRPDERAEVATLSDATVLRAPREERYSCPPVLRRPDITVGFGPKTAHGLIVRRERIERFLVFIFCHADPRCQVLAAREDPGVGECPQYIPISRSSDPRVPLCAACPITPQVHTLLHRRSALRCAECQRRRNALFLLLRLLLPSSRRCKLALAPSAEAAARRRDRDAPGLSRTTEP